MMHRKWHGRYKNPIASKPLKRAAMPCRTSEPHQRPVGGLAIRAPPLVVRSAPSHRAMQRPTVFPRRSIPNSARQVTRLPHERCRA